MGILIALSVNQKSVNVVYIVTWPQLPAPCPVCDKLVFYRAGRRRCSQCGQWCHEECSLDDTKSPIGRASCVDCCHNKILTLNHVDSFLDCLEVYEKDDHELYKSGRIFVASIFLGHNSDKIAALTGYNLDEVEERATRLRDNNIWTEGGKLGLDEVNPDEPNESSITFLFCIMCADGLVQRVPQALNVTSGV